MQEIYKINGADFLNPSSEYLDKESYPNFQKKLEEFKSLLAKQVENNSGISYFKFGDGDYYFLKKQPKGSAKPGNRALSKKYWRINHKEFANGSKENDYFMCEIMKQNREYFYELFSKDFDFPGEFVYGLLSNKWLLKNFKNEIGIIGAKEKIEIINELMKRAEYQEYLGIDKFNKVNRARNQRNRLIGIGFDYKIGENAMLFFRHNRYRYFDPNFVENHLQGTENMLELKITF